MVITWTRSILSQNSVKPPKLPKNVTTIFELCNSPSAHCITHFIPSAFGINISYTVILPRCNFCVTFVLLCNFCVTFVYLLILLPDGVTANSLGLLIVSYLLSNKHVRVLRTCWLCILVGIVARFQPVSPSLFMARQES